MLGLWETSSITSHHEPPLALAPQLITWTTQPQMWDTDWGDQVGRDSCGSGDEDYWGNVAVALHWCQVVLACFRLGYISHNCLLCVSLRKSPPSVFIVRLASGLWQSWLVAQYGCQKGVAATLRGSEDRSWWAGDGEGRAGEEGGWTAGRLDSEIEGCPG